jgi:hypothetical protein
MGAALLAQLDDPTVAPRLQERFAELHDSLRCDTASRAAQALLSIREQRTGAG